MTAAIAAVTAGLATRTRRDADRNAEAAAVTAGPELARPGG